jgi:hypothetical protein
MIFSNDVQVVGVCIRFDLLNRLAAWGAAGSVKRLVANCYLMSCSCYA